MTTKALIIGGDGLLGRALSRRLTHEGIVWNATSRQSNRQGTPTFLDLNEPTLRLSPVDYTVMYIVAAITKVVDCEADPAKTWRVNADGPVELARQAGRWPDCRVVFVSSDAVERAPNLNYSRQKAYVESYVLATGGAIIRPSRIPTEHVESLAEKMITIGVLRQGGLFRWTPPT